MWGCQSFLLHMARKKTANSLLVISPWGFMEKALYFLLYAASCCLKSINEQADVGYKRIPSSCGAAVLLFHYIAVYGAVCNDTQCHIVIVLQIKTAID